MTEQSCQTCAEVFRGPEPDVTSDKITAQRLLLAVLRGDADATVAVAREVNECHGCQGRLLALFLAMSAGSTVLLTGSQEKAIESVQQGLSADLGGE